MSRTEKMLAFGVVLACMWCTGLHRYSTETEPGVKLMRTTARRLAKHLLGLPNMEGKTIPELMIEFCNMVNRNLDNEEGEGKCTQSV